jgi:hypothetical protein
MAFWGVYFDIGGGVICSSVLWELVIGSVLPRFCF